MKSTDSKKISINDYIKDFPVITQKKLKTINGLFKKYAPKAIATYAYGIPTYKLNKNIGHFAGYKNHIGFYPGPKTIIKFKKELIEYQCTKGTVKLPLDQPTPTSLLIKMIKFNVKNDKVLLTKKRSKNGKSSK